MADGQRPWDWATAEMLAFVTLVTEGTRLRMSGQDSQRGTFSQRHSVLHDYRSGETYMPLKHLSSGQAPVDIINSPLSEAGVLGFDYGYSLDCPDGLIIWEAQFGDFSNAAQVIIDQFIASAEDKWDRLSGIVMLLPHGFEGQGPEHSSGRIERFLMLAADDNMQVVYPTTPAQHFHVLRRQVLRRWKKPLIVFTPKSLLRHKDATSQLSDLATSNFQPVIADPVADSKAIRKILLCSGKVYYDLPEVQANRKLDELTIIRIEESYPLPIAALEDALADFPEGTPVCWVQEEPENMGAWRFIWSHLASRENGRLLGRFPLSVVCRPASASPATGSATSHKFEQRTVLHAAFDVPEGNAS